MPGGDLSRDEVAALLDTTDQPLLAAALDVISRRQGWAVQLVAIATRLLTQKELTDAEQSLLSGALVGLAKNDKVQALVGEKLAAADTRQSTKLLLLDVIARSDLRPLPAAWVEPLNSLLAEVDGPLTHAAVVTVSDSDQFDEPLTALARHEKGQFDARVAAFSVVVPRLDRLTDADFVFLLDAAKPDAPPVSRAAAAQALTTAKLSERQWNVVLDKIAESGPLEIRTYVQLFEDVAEVEDARKLLGAIGKSPGKSALNDEDIERIAMRFRGDEQLYSLSLALYSVLKSKNNERPFSLAIDPRSLPTGSVDSGKHVFFGRKAACSSCHRVASEGGKIGPDLSKVGERRSERDLLEAVIVPSASLARGYESHVFRTADGRTLTGLVVRETAESLFLRTSDQREIRLRRSDIEEQKPSELSIMPAGLENTMTRQELADLLAYLKSLK
jgi:putative heme-binding domain-containing protein